MREPLQVLHQTHFTGGKWRLERRIHCHGQSVGRWKTPLGPRPGFHFSGAGSGNFASTRGSFRALPSLPRDQTALRPVSHLPTSALPQHGRQERGPQVYLLGPGPQHQPPAGPLCPPRPGPTPGCCAHHQPRDLSRAQGGPGRLQRLLQVSVGPQGQGGGCRPSKREDLRAGHLDGDGSEGKWLGLAHLWVWREVQ